MYFLVNFISVSLSIAAGCVFATSLTFDGFLNDQTEADLSRFQDFDVEAAEAEYQQMLLLRGSRAIETTTPKMCNPTATCGFQEYTDIDETPGKTKDWHNVCSCPEGTECIRTGLNMRQEWWRYTCEFLPTEASTESLSRTSTDLNKRLGSVHIHPEL